MNTYLLISTLVGFLLVMAWRMRETTRPINARRIVIPPLGMATGFSMFAYAPMRIPLAWAAIAFALGVLVFAYPLIKSSKLTRVGDVVMLKRSPAFLLVIVGLFLIRLVARSYVERYINAPQTAAIFFVLAFGMIVTWRVRMFFEYRRLQRDMLAPSTAALPTV
jgi:membrane protein CcdC involved in cytochrome C biogenesis